MIVLLSSAITVSVILGGLESTIKLSEIKKTYPNKKVFLCPGTCGDCTSIGHACGNLEIFKNYSIVLPIH